MMNRSLIDWCDFSWNPVTGCNFGCEYCYARRQATRFAGNTRLNMTNEQLKTDTAGLYILEQPFKNYNGAVLPVPAGFASIHSSGIQFPKRSAMLQTKMFAGGF